jgi:hypothetical protein
MTAKDLMRRIVTAPTENANLLKKMALGIILFSLAPFLILTVWATPAYDDWVMTQAALTSGFLGAQKVSYFGWTGRYTATALLSANPLVWDSFRGYKLISLALIVLTFVALYAFITVVFQRHFGRLERFLGAAFLLALFTNQTPDVTEAYYWMTGAVTYQGGCIFGLLFLSGLIAAGTSSGMRRWLMSVIAGVFLILTIGSNETVMFVMWAVMIPVAIFKFIERHEDRWLVAVFVLLTAICSAVVILAPGNAVRSSWMTGSHRFFYSLEMSLLQEIRFIVTWIGNVPFILATIFFVPIAATIRNRIPVLIPISRRPLLLSAWLLLLIFIGMFPAYWVTGNMGQHRTVNTVYFFFLIAWFLNVVAWVSYAGTRDAVNFKLPRYVWAFGVPVLLSGLLFLNNTRTAFMDVLSLRAYHYAKAADQKRQLLRSCMMTQLSDCSTQPIADLPETITNPYYELQPGPEKSFWRFRAKSARRP